MSSQETVRLLSRNINQSESRPQGVSTSLSQRLTRNISPDPLIRDIHNKAREAEGKSMNTTRNFNRFRASPIVDAGSLRISHLGRLPNVASESNLHKVKDKQMIHSSSVPKITM